MNTLFSRDLHPDANSLNAFAEHLLPKPEYQRVLAHIADCDQCRQVMHLVQDASPSQAHGKWRHVHSLPQLFWSKDWLTGWNVGWAAAALCTIIGISFSLHERRSKENIKVSNSSVPLTDNAIPQQSPDRTKAGPMQSAAGGLSSEKAVEDSVPLSRPTSSNSPEETATQSIPSSPPAAVNAHTETTVESPPATISPSAPVAASVPRNEVSVERAAVADAKVGESVNSLPLLKKKIVVLDFDDADVKQSLQAFSGTDQEVGKGITRLLIDKLSADGFYTVIDSDAAIKILKEQNFSSTNRLNPASAARIGKLLGADEVIIGEVDSFGWNNQRGAGAGGTWYGGLSSGASSVQRSKVILNASIVDVNAGQIAVSLVGTGLVERNGLGGLGSLNAPRSETGSSNINSPGFEATTIGKAVKSAIAELVTKLDAESSRLQLNPALTPVSGYVMSVVDNELAINVGSSQGVRVGDILNVTEVSHVIRDPATGRPILSVNTAIGTVTITSVETTTAKGNFKGSATAKIGDTVKSR